MHGEHLLDEQVHEILNSRPYSRFTRAPARRHRGDYYYYSGWMYDALVARPLKCVTLLDQCQRESICHRWPRRTRPSDLSISLPKILEKGARRESINTLG